MIICSVRFCSLHRIPIRVLLDFANSTGSPGDGDKEGNIYTRLVRYNIINITVYHYYNNDYKGSKSFILLKN